MGSKKNPVLPCSTRKLSKTTHSPGRSFLVKQMSGLQAFRLKLKDPYYFVDTQLVLSAGIPETGDSWEFPDFWASRFPVKGGHDPETGA